MVRGFFFYGLGHVRMGKYELDWALHMILVLLSGTGLMLKDGSSSGKTIRLLAVAIILITAVLLLTQGNKLGEEPLNPSGKARNFRL
jgi:L-rhamnose-H+ transport protein